MYSYKPVQLDKGRAMHQTYIEKLQNPKTPSQQKTELNKDIMLSQK
jgi:hypothetical protein